MNEEKILVSACLAGRNCKYNGKNNLNEKILKLVDEGKAVLVCPEQLGGLPTPRVPSEILSKRIEEIKNFNNKQEKDSTNIKSLKTRVINKEGEDVTKQFTKGAEETLKIAKKYNIKKAILKSKSPSCGYGKIYDGSFSGNLIEGNGITTNLLLENGIKIMSSDEF